MINGFRSPSKSFSLPHARLEIFEHQGQLKTNLTLRPNLSRKKPCPLYAQMAFALAKIANEGIGIDELVSRIHGVQEQMDANDRKKLWSMIADGYCLKCAEKKNECSCSKIITPTLIVPP